MKKMFLESNGYNMVGFLFDDGMVTFDCETLEEAKAMDISNVEGSNSAVECAACCGLDVDSFIYPFNEDEWEKVIEL